MYSFAPAWMAATAARASVEVPHATTGTMICSASSRVIRSRMSMATSTINRSAPRPERSTRSAISASSAWVTPAPFAMASLVASVSCPRRVPTIRRRMGSVLLGSLSQSASGELRMASRENGVHSLFAIHYSLVPLRLDHFRHGDAELLLDQHHFAARDQPVVDVDVDRLADLAVEFEHGARPELQQVADVHFRTPKHGRDLYRHIEHRFEIGGGACGLGCVRRERHFARHGAAVPVELRERHLGFVTHRKPPTLIACRYAPPHSGRPPRRSRLASRRGRATRRLPPIRCGNRPAPCRAPRASPAAPE